MRILLAWLISAIFGGLVGGDLRGESLVEFVDPRIGTAIKGDGGTLPCVGPPFAMTNFTAATVENAVGQIPYFYDHNELIGFMGSHQPSQGMGDYGFVTIWPCMDVMQVDPEARKLRFSHDREVSKPYFYSVEATSKASGKNLKVELTATERCALFTFDMRESETAYIAVETSRNKGLFNAERHRKRYYPEVNAAFDALRERVIKDGYVEVNPERGEITGYNPEWHSFHIGPTLKNFAGYFVVQFEHPFEKFGTWQGPVITPEQKTEKGKWTGGYAGFPGHSVIRMKVGTSFISIEQARENLRREIPDWDVARVQEKTREAWEKRLQQIRITASDQQKRVFYTAMFHTLLYPRIFSEYGRYYSAADDRVHEGVSYNDYSLWDTFRAEHPLLLFLARDHAPGMINAMIQMYEQGGRLPKWPNPAETNIMIGTHADAVIADAMVKGVTGFDLERAYAGMRKDAFVPPDGDTGNEHFTPNLSRFDTPPATLAAGAGNHWWPRDFWHGAEARGGLSWYQKLGYVPVEMTGESVSRTLEYAYDDFCVAQVAQKLGKTDDAKILRQRSQNYRNVYNPTTGMMASRWSTGEFKDGPFTLNGRVENGFTEGSPWTYLFCAMQDVEGLAKLMGGNEAFVTKLDETFAGKHYQHSNEPGHHYTYLYDYVGQPWKTQEKVRSVATSLYHDTPDGIFGNDDCGQMSAWYVFSAMGFYPVCPGKPEYAIGSPFFPEVKLALGNGRELVIKANHVSAANLYIASVTLNGERIDSPFLRHEQLMAGGTLEFEMSATPNRSWGAR